MGNPNRNRSKVTRTLPETQEDSSLPGILASIVRDKRDALTELATRIAELQAGVVRAPPTRDFRAALARPGGVSLIAECKRRSPGAGAIRPDLDPAALAVDYEAAGAAAVSVLTDRKYFGGTLADLEAVKSATSLPILRKDFTLHSAHLLEARAAGADAVLLIVRILDDPTLATLHEEALSLGLHVLVEVHDATELARAVDVGASIIGINNRDLSTFTTDLKTTERLLADMPDDVVVVSESGIRTRADVEGLGDAGVDAILVGESILRADDPGQAALELAGVSRRPRVGRIEHP